MIGSEIGPYRIDAQLGAGGMGVVYSAVDTTLDRTVALKFLPPHLSADEKAKKRFIQEAKAASALDHANICTIHHIGETEDGRVYIVMSHYDGQTLKYRLSEGPLPEDEACSIASQLAAGLHRAHEAGIVHRDIKPANIMVTERGEVKILDFGIAKLGGVSDLTGEGSTLGTVAYMSPEQARGETVGPASDLWSLGVVLYEMLSGKRPFDAEYDQALLYAVLNESPVDIQDVAPDVSEDVANLLRGLLSKDPAARPGSAAHVYKALGGSTGTMHASPLAMAAGASGSAAVPASVAGVVTRFALGGIAGLSLVYAAMMVFGLPDWVFPAGVLLLLAGAPITLYATRLEHRRAEMNTGERRSLQGLAQWLTVRRALTGGVFALAALGLLSAGYMGLRAMGIGPAATLITSGAFSSNDVVVVATLDDQSRDGNLGAPISEALRVDLGQSNVVHLMDGDAVRAALERMSLPGDTVLTADIAREVALRQGAKAVLVGGVSSLGSSTVINLRLVGASDGNELLSLRETAKTDDDVVDAVDRLSARLRESIGESLISIRASAPLEQVTTASLEALRLYTMGVDAKDRDDAQAALGFLTSAVEIDTSFAMAYRIMASVENNRWGSIERMRDYASKAYRNRDRLPRREQLYATEAYYSWVEPNTDRQAQVLEELLVMDPNDLRALNNLSLHHRYRTGDYAKSLEYTARMIELIPDRTQGYINHFYTLTRTGDWEHAQAMLDSIRVRQPDFGGLVWMQVALDAEQTGNYSAAVDSIRGIRARKVNDEAAYFLNLYESSILQMLGRLREADFVLERVAQNSLDIDNAGGMLIDLAWAYTYRYLIDQDSVQAVRRYEDLLARANVTALDSMSQAHGDRAYMLAALGHETEARDLMSTYKHLRPAHTLASDHADDAVEGMIALRAGQFDEAARRFTNVLGKTRIPRIYEHELGIALLASGRTNEAVDRLESAARSTGWQGLAYDSGTGTLALRSLGQAYEAAGRTRDAITAYSEFVDRWANADAELAPQRAEVQDRINRLERSLSTDQ